MLAVALRSLDRLERPHDVLYRHRLTEKTGAERFTRNQVSLDCHCAGEFRQYGPEPADCHRAIRTLYTCREIVGSPVE